MSMINLLNEQSDPDSVKNDSGPIDLTNINLAPTHKKSFIFLASWCICNMRYEMTFETGLPICEEN